MSEYVSKKFGDRRIDRYRKFSRFDAAAELLTPEEQAYFLKDSREHRRGERIPVSYLIHAQRVVMRARGMHPRRPKSRIAG